MQIGFVSSELLNLRRLGLAACLLAMVAGAGCTWQNQPESAVVGTVQLDGKLVSQGSILLIDPSGKLATAPLQADGSYSLRCSPGKYHVAVSPPPSADPFAPKSAGTSVTVLKVPQMYHDVGTSGLSADVKSGSNTINFELDSKAKI